MEKYITAKNTLKFFDDYHGFLKRLDEEDLDINNLSDVDYNMFYNFSTCLAMALTKDYSDHRELPSKDLVKMAKIILVNAGEM